MEKKRSFNAGIVSSKGDCTDKIYPRRDLKVLINLIAVFGQATGINRYKWQSLKKSQSFSWSENFPTPI